MRIDVIVNIIGSCPVNKGANPLSAHNVLEEV